MRKFISIMCLFAASSAIASAQIKDGFTFEVGAGYAFTYSIIKDAGFDKVTGPGVYFEFREGDGGLFDLGAQIHYKYATGDAYTFEGEREDFKARCNEMGLKGVMDINICPDDIVNPYIGGAMGFGGMYMNSSADLRGSFFYPIIGLRFGVQIQRFRLALELDNECMGVGWRVRSWGVSRSTYRGLASTLGLNLAYTF